MKHLRLVFSWALLLFVTSVSQTAVAQVADGGVWKTSDGGSNWTPLTDTQVSLSAGSIALDPSIPTRSTLALEKITTPQAVAGATKIICFTRKRLGRIRVPIRNVQTKSWLNR